MFAHGVYADAARLCDSRGGSGRRDDFVEISHAHTLRDQYGGVSHLVEFGGETLMLLVTP